MTEGKAETREAVENLRTCNPPHTGLQYGLRIVQMSTVPFGRDLSRRALVQSLLLNTFVTCFLRPGNIQPLE